jgi:prophage antirepressor-like protein
MTDEIKEDNNCIVKAFENNPISIITEEIDNKKLYCFKASDIGKALNIVNIRTSIMNFDGDEVVVRTTYDTIKRKQETLFLTSQGVYRLLLINLNAFYFKNLFKDKLYIYISI